MSKRAAVLSFLILVTAGSSLNWAVQNKHPDFEQIGLGDASGTFQPSPSPNQNELLFYAARDKDEPSVGNLVRVNLSNRSVKELENLQGIAVSSQIAWSPDGTAAYFDALDGLYRLNMTTNRSHLIYRGLVSGVAASSDNSIFAFWSHESNGVYKMRVMSVKNSRKIREWELPHLYGGEIAGFDIAFTADGTTVVSRTYDTEVSTPLKQFVIASGTVRTLVNDCYAATTKGSSIYAISVVGAKKNLVRLPPDAGAPTLIQRDIDYDSLLNSSDSRLLVLQNSTTRVTVFFDLETERFQDKVVGCDWATIMKDGQRLYARNGTLSSSTSICQSAGGRVARDD